MNFVNYLDNAILEKESRKTLSIRVYPDGTIVIKAPKEATDEEINSFISRKKLWVSKQLDFFNKFKVCDTICDASGASILYLGRQYQFIIEKSIKNNVIQVSHNKIILYTNFPQKRDEIQKFLTNWLSLRAEYVFLQQLKQMVHLFPDMNMPKLKVRKLNKRWGSYLKNHTIILNPCLVRASKRAINYVILHELCHHYYDKHTKAFYNMLTSKMPDWERISEMLEKQVLGK